MPVNINELKIKAGVPAGSAENTVNCQISINGKAIDNVFAIQAVDISLAANARARATIVILDEVVNGLPATNNPEFTPGKAVEVFLGYNDGAAQAFSGIINAQSLSINEGDSKLTLICESAETTAYVKTIEPAIKLQPGATIVELSTDLTTTKDGALQLKGRASFMGTLLVPADRIEITGLARHIDGIHLVDSVHHTLILGEWTTEITFSGNN